MGMKLTKEEVINHLDICALSNDGHCDGCKLYGTDRKFDRDDMSCMDYLMKCAREYLLGNEPETPKEKTQHETNAEAIKNTYDAFIKVGFEKDQAFELTRTIVDKIQI